MSSTEIEMQSERDRERQRERASGIESARERERETGFCGQLQERGGGRTSMSRARRACSIRARCRPARAKLERLCLASSSFCAACLSYLETEGRSGEILLFVT